MVVPYYITMIIIQVFLLLVLLTIEGAKKGGYNEVVSSGCITVTLVKCCRFKIFCTKLFGPVKIDRLFHFFNCAWWFFSTLSVSGYLHEYT